ncbi:FecR domain-containing protein [Chelatococcus sp. SYSU_G07232]|uniref:FecR domain-containing protein n=1 Tax=Chelatococcus albus TaxID=3047466 RepID=A0ABT7ABE2_9HYPH|nr:FecR domain-containing protein [Chelatococcus sp. SYSU_G07232]MDJ1156681.1 FecR domain-containing protein [Chelatococcus sp. SYSU_G07232]
MPSGAAKGDRDMAVARDKGDDPVLDQALDWLLAIQDAPDDGDLRAGRDAWIAESEAHARAYRKAERTWRLTGELAGRGLVQRPTTADGMGGAVRPGNTSAISSERRRGSVGAAPPSRPRRRPAPRWAAAATLVLAAGLLLAGAPDLMRLIAADHRTGTAETRRIALPDGSALTLDARSAVAVDFSAAERRIRLLAGGAFFDVRPDAARPFIVAAGEATATAVGTAFEVQVGPHRLSTAVAEGVVRFERPGSGERLAAGEEIAVELGSGEERRRRRDPAEVAGWREGRLVAEDDAIADVVRELANHHHGFILTLDSRLARKRVTGIYDLRRPIEALRAVVQPFGGSVREITPYLVLVAGP